MNAPTLFLVCGLPGAGKTTRSQEIVEAMLAVHLSADEWLLGLGMSLVDYEFRPKLQQCLLRHAQTLLEMGISVVLEFGSWHRHEREEIQMVGYDVGAMTELHFLDAPVDELVRRVRARGGPFAEALATDVLLRDAPKFERPTPEEIAQFDRYIGPTDTWVPFHGRS
jgi:predicted kinase